MGGYLVTGYSFISLDRVTTCALTDYSEKAMKIRRTLTVLASALAMLATTTAANAAIPGLSDPFAGAEFIELKAPTPSWFTAELAAEAHAAGLRGEGVAIPDGVDYPTSGLLFTGIRPGAWILEPAGCTTNFVFGST